MKDHYFLRASSDFDSVKSSAEKALKSLNFDFLQNTVRDLVELEVVNPRYFRVVIEKRADPEVQNFILPSIKQAKGTSIDVRFDAGKIPSQEAIADAKQFLRKLVSLLPSPPWAGLKFRESGREKKRWMEVTEEDNA